MNISAPFIARPVATTLLTLAIALAGILGFSQIAGVAAAAGGLSDHLGLGDAARRQSRDRVHQRRRAARTSPRPDRRRHRDDLAKRHRTGAHHAAIRHHPRHRRRRARRRGGDQCGARRPAHQPAEQSDLPQSQSGRCADHGPGADLEDDDARPDVRRRQQHLGAAALAIERHRQRQYRRLEPAGGARRAQPAGALQLRHRPGGRPRRARLGQRQQSKRHHRRRRPAFPDLYQRSGERCRRLHATGDRLSQRRRGAALRCRRGQGFRSGQSQSRHVQRPALGAGHPLPPAERQYHRDGRRREGGAAASASGNAGRHERQCRHRPQHHDPRLVARHRSDAGAGGPAGHRRRVPVPAQHQCDADPERRRADLDLRHLRRHVSARL